MYTRYSHVQRGAASPSPELLVPVITPPSHVQRGAASPSPELLVPVITPPSHVQRGAASPSPELLFQTMDSEKLLLVERLCRHKKELARLEEKIEFFEEHISQLTDDIQRKSKCVQCVCVGVYVLC